MAELTPEERQKIYLEEKARLEIKLQLDKEQKSFQENEKQVKANSAAKGCLYVIGGFFILLIFANLFMSVIQALSGLWVPIIICGCLTIALKVIGFSKKDLILVSGGSLAVGVGVTLLVNGYLDKSNLENAAKVRANKIALVKATPEFQVHINKAESLLKQVNHRSHNFEHQHRLIADANMEISQIPPDLREFTASQTTFAKAAALEAQISKLEEEYKKAHPSAADRMAAVLIRKGYAAKFETMLLEKNIDATVTTGGKDHTTIIVKYALMNRPLVYSLSHNEEGQNGLRVMGFKKMIATDGYSSSWTVDL